MINPIIPVNMTRIIHITELSIPLALASRATQTSSAMLRTMNPTMRKLQTPQPAKAAPVSGALCAQPALAEMNPANERIRNLVNVRTFVLPQTESSYPKATLNDFIAGSKGVFPAQIQTSSAVAA
jgi:hypothetical protein